MSADVSSPPEFESLAQACRPQLLRFVARMVGDGNAEDVVQVTLAKAALALATFRGEASPKSWLFRIATNAAHDWNRSHPGTTSAPLPEGDEEIPGELIGEADQERRLIREQMSDCVAGIFQRLPEHYQAALALGDCEDLSDRELADALGLTVGAAKIRLHRARKRLKQALEQNCQFYRDEDNVLCCDRKPGEIPDLSGQKNNPAEAYRFNEGIRHQGESREVGENQNQESPMATETLPTKQKHLIGIGAAIAAGCQPCTTSFVAAAREAGACDRGVRLALTTGQRGRAAANAEMATFADHTFPNPAVDEAFRAERAQLLSLMEIAAAMAGNAATLLAPRIAAARKLGATDAQIHLASQIGLTARRGAEQATEEALAQALGQAVPHGNTRANSSACGCGEKTSASPIAGCGCGTS
jgi:RNA polymerase sigma-70 factor (ECF subfamily)